MVTKARAPAPVLCNKRSCHSERPGPATGEQPRSPQPEKSQCSFEDLPQSKINKITKNNKVPRTEFLLILEETTPGGGNSTCNGLRTRTSVTGHEKPRVWGWLKNTGWCDVNGMCQLTGPWGADICSNGMLGVPVRVFLDGISISINTQEESGLPPPANVGGLHPIR